MIEPINEIHELRIILANDAGTPERPPNLNPIKWLKNCTDIEEALNNLRSPGISSDLREIQKALLIRYSINENFEELNSAQLHELAQIFHTKAAVILFMSKDFNSMLIYWKSKEIDYFLNLAVTKKKSVQECKEIYAFTVDFLIESLCRGHLGLQKDCKHSQESNKIELNQLADSDNLNILQISAESGETECVKILLDLGILGDTPYQPHNAPSLALNKQHYDTLLTLMEGNFTYPPLMDINKLPTEVQQYVKICEELHEAVMSKNIDRVVEIVKQNPNRRHFYNKNNQSVLKIALEKNLYNMYEILLSNDVSFGPHEHFARVFAGLSESDKTILREIHFRCSKDLPEHHMNVLMMNTSISHDDTEKEGKEELVLRAYRFLNKNPLLNPILKVVAASKRFDIIFDFKRDSVYAVDPTAPPEMRGSYYVDGRICVGAKQLLDPATEHETFGTLAHELCHYAMNLTFKNRAKPYLKSDQQTKVEYKEIVKFCKEHRDKEEIIKLVFDYEDHLHSAELIVRPAHLLALYDNQPEKLAELQYIYKGLFIYYIEKVIPAMLNAISSIRRKADVEFKEKDKKIFKLTRNFYIAIGLGILIAALVGIYFHKPSYVFDELSNDDQDKVRNAFVSYKNVSVKFKDLFRNDSMAYGKLTSDHITDMLGGKVLDFDDPLLHYLDEIVSFKWDDMAKNIGEKFLESDLNFQGQSIKFKNLNESSPEAFYALTSNQIKNVLSQKTLEIGENLTIGSEFYVNRKFLPEDAKMLIFEYQFGHEYRDENSIDITTYRERHILARTKNKSFQRFCDEFFKLNSTTRSQIFDKVRQNSYFKTQTYDLNHKDFLFMHENSRNIIEKVEKEKIFVLSSEAGAGKTVTFEHFAKEIKEKHPKKWVSYIDLKAHSRFYQYNDSVGLGGSEEGSRLDFGGLGSHVSKNDQNTHNLDLVSTESYLWTDTDTWVNNIADNIQPNASTTSKIHNKSLNSTNSFPFSSNSNYFSSKNVKNLLKNILNVSPEKNEFEVRIFEESFKSGNLVLVWNGYDEITPIYSDFILNLIKFISNKTKNVQYVCTRPLYSDQLSQVFNVRTWQLVPLDENEKRGFLKKYFISQKISNDKIDVNIQNVEKIVNKLQYADKLYRDFNTPLMLKLVAEIHIDKILMLSGNTYGIYETFVRKKIKIWLQKGESAHKTTEDLIFLGSKFNIIEIYQKYAFLNEINLFTLSTLGLKLQKLQIMQKEIPKDLKFDEISQMGILYINGKNKFEFAHKTFAEFFIAQYFIENVYNAPNDVQEDEAELRLELFFKLTKDFGEKQNIITNFMSSFLQMEKIKGDEKFASAISKLLRTKFRKFLFRMLDTNYPKVFEFLFEFFKKDHDLLVELLQVHETETFYTAIFNPSYFALFTNAEEIKNLSKNYLNPAEYEKFLTGVNQKGIIYYGLYFYEEVDGAKSHPEYDEFIKSFMYDTYWEFFQKIKEHLTDTEQKQMFLAAINPKIYLYYNRIAHFFHGFETFLYGYGDLWGRYEDLLTPNETKNALGNALVEYNELNPCCKKGNDILITTLISYIEEMNLEDFQIFEMFKTKNILHESHYLSYAFESLWYFLSNHTTKEQRREILYRDDKDDKNFYFYSIYGDNKAKFGSYAYHYYFYDFTPFKIFHRAFIVPKTHTLNLTLEIYGEHFSKEEIQDLIMASNDFLYYVVDTADEDTFRIFVNYLEELFKGNETKLKNYLKREIKPTNLSIFKFIENFKELPHIPANWFSNIEMLWKLYKG